MGMTVVTYGGGEILKNIFNAIAMLMNQRSGGIIQPLMMITASIGSVWAISKAFFSSSAQTFLLQFFFPFIAIVGLLMVPTATVHIEDVLKNRSETVDHVPLLVAKFAELSSSIGYQITRAIENTMHVPDDVSYNSTGMIFGADTAMDISRYKITNADLDKNLRTFCRQCILYDLHLGRYSIDELKKTTDLWKFLEERTSKVRMIKYTPIDSGTSPKNASTGVYLSCKDAIKTMTPYFELEKRYYGQLDVCKNLPLTFQALTGLQKDAEELISQQLMMNLLTNEYSGNNFANARAYVQQRNTYQVVGSLASSSLVTLRAVIEALIYAAFIFVLPLSILPGGIKFITTWVGLVLWIQLWPPFYAILNYIMQSVAHGYANTILHGVSGLHQGLSFFTSIGLHDLQQDIYALSGYLAASIPFITYAILKGGVGSFVQIAGSVMSPGHSAASTAAAEQTSGNYSFGNTSMGQMS
jgi:conjugal transfer mating pair stabilization protein TraG